MSIVSSKLHFNENLTEKEFNLLLTSINESSKENRNFLFLYFTFLVIVIFTIHNITAMDYLKNNDVNIIFYSISVDVDSFLQIIPFMTFIFHIFIIQNLMEHQKKVRLYFNSEVKDMNYEVKKNLLFPFIFNAILLYKKKEYWYTLDFKFLIALLVIMYVTPILMYQNLAFLVNIPILNYYTYIIITLILIVFFVNLVYFYHTNRVLFKISIFLYFSFIFISTCIFVKTTKFPFHNSYTINSPINTSADNIVRTTVNDIKFNDRYLANIEFINVSIKNSFFQNSTMEKINIIDSTIFENVYFENMKLNNIKIQNSVLKSIVFSGTRYSEINNLSITNGTLKNVEFKSIYINNSNFDRPNIINTKFDDVKFTDLKLRDVNFTDTKFINCTFQFSKKFIEDESIDDSTIKNLNDVQLVNCTFKLGEEKMNLDKLKRKAKVIYNEK